MLEKIGNFLPGVKTYMGLAISLLGGLAVQLNWAWFDAAAMQEMVNAGLLFGGLVVAFIGRIVAKPKV